MKCHRNLCLSSALKIPRLGRALVPRRPTYRMSRADAQNTQSGQFRYAMGPITNELTAEILLNRSFIGALKALE